LTGNFGKETAENIQRTASKPTSEQALRHYTRIRKCNIRPKQASEYQRKIDEKESGFEALSFKI
jgi:hypothetical protein